MALVNRYGGFRYGQGAFPFGQEIAIGEVVFLRVKRRPGIVAESWSEHGEGNEQGEHDEDFHLIPPTVHVVNAVA
jgi:hypothetical protein